MGKRATDANAIVAGQEPVATTIVAGSEDYNIAFGRALNWYSNHQDLKTARRYLVDAAKAGKKDKDTIASIASLSNDDTPTTLAWCLRLLMRGAVLEQKHILALQDRITRLYAKIEAARAIEAAQEKAKKVGKTIQESMKQKGLELLGQLEGKFDDEGYLGGDRVAFQYFVSENVPPAYMPIVVDWADQKIREYGTVLVTKDEQIKEGYSNFTKKQIGEIVKYFASIKQQANDYAQHKKVNRPPRARKEKPPIVQVKRVKYLPIDPETKVTSIEAASIIGADQLWTYNAKTRVLAVYRATGSLGLRVKGTTLINYDTECSEQKKLRKPEVTLKELKEAGKVPLRRLMDKIKAKGKVPNGRINKDTVLVRAL